MVKQTAKWIDVLDLIELLRGVNVDFVLISAKPSTHTHTHTNANANTKKKQQIRTLSIRSLHTNFT